MNTKQRFPRTFSQPVSLSAHCSRTVGTTAQSAKLYACVIPTISIHASDHIAVKSDTTM